jgi:hypothetical protein
MSGAACAPVHCTGTAHCAVSRRGGSTKIAFSFCCTFAGPTRFGSIPADPVILKLSISDSEK